MLVQHRMGFPCGSTPSSHSLPGWTETSLNNSGRVFDLIFYHNHIIMYVYAGRVLSSQPSCPSPPVACPAKAGITITLGKNKKKHQTHVSRRQNYGYVFPTVIGQSSSVMDDQKIQIITTDSSVKSVSKSAPSILPLVPLQMCELMA